MPEPVAAAVVEFVTGALLDNPERVGKPLRQQLTGLHVARRGTFRVVYRILDHDRVVEVIDVGHRRDVYRGRT
jgi:mRNA interferase RelE/StbE